MELLITVTIIAILAALLFPALAHGKTRVKRTVCKDIRLSSAYFRDEVPQDYIPKN